MKKNWIIAGLTLAVGLTLGTVTGLVISDIHQTRENQQETSSGVADQDTESESETEPLTGQLESLHWKPSDLTMNLQLPETMHLSEDTCVPGVRTAGYWGIEIDAYSYTDFVAEYGYENNLFGYDGMLYRLTGNETVYRDAVTRETFLMPDFSAGRGGEIVACTDSYQIINLSCKMDWQEQTLTFECWLIEWGRDYALVLPKNCCTLEEIREIAEDSSKY